MKRIELTNDGITFEDEVEAFGECRTEELSVEHTDRDEFELELDTGGFVSLESLIDVEYEEDGSLVSVSLEFDQLPSARAAISRQDTQSESELPAVPQIDVSDLDVGGRQSFYKRLCNSPGSQPDEIRRLIHEHQELNREEFDRLVDEELGYTSDAGGTNMSLIVLEEVTEEIERQGRGDDQRIVWTG